MLLLSLELDACCITTFPMHSPIYPDAGEDVTYSLSVEAEYAITKIELFEQVTSVGPSGPLKADPETLLEEWHPLPQPSSYDASFTKLGGYPADSRVRYRFVVSGPFGVDDHSHEVTFAIRPYPVQWNGMPIPAPVYCQSDPDRSIDLVFVPDTGVTSQDLFRDQCQQMITEAMWHDPTLRASARAFNYFINPLSGVAVDRERVDDGERHNRPDNHKNLSFAEGLVLMHQHSFLQDWSDYLWRILSTEIEARWTLLHELGHLVFGLADELMAAPGTDLSGGHWEVSCPAPPCYHNNWKDEAVAEADVVHYPGKTAADVRKMGTEAPLQPGDPPGQDWYKLCVDLCQMDAPAPMDVARKVPGTFDVPCAQRIRYWMLFGKKVP